MCRSMVDIQSAAAEIRRGKMIEEDRNTGQKYNGLPYYIGQPYNNDYYWTPRHTMNNDFAFALSFA